jgi:hypothetical protein
MKTLEQIKLETIENYCNAQLGDIEELKKEGGYNEDITLQFTTIAREYELRIILNFIGGKALG